MEGISKGKEKPPPPWFTLELCYITCLMDQETICISDLRRYNQSIKYYLHESRWANIGKFPYRNIGEILKKMKNNDIVFTNGFTEIYKNSLWFFPEHKEAKSSAQESSVYSQHASYVNLVNFGKNTYD